MKEDKNNLDLYRFPKEWAMKSIKDQSLDLLNGYASGQRDENGVIQIRMNNITTDGKFNMDKVIRVPIPPNDIYTLKKGDLLFNNTNSLELVGKSAVILNENIKMTFSNHFTRIRFNTDNVLSEWVASWFALLWRRGFFKKNAVRYVGQVTINIGFLQKIPLPLPKIHEQKIITRILKTINDAIDICEQKIQKTEKLKKGMMQKLLTRGIGHTKFKKTELGEIPEKWEIIQLGNSNFFELAVGGTPSKAEPTYWEKGNINWVRSADLIEKYIYKTEKKITKQGLENSAAKLLPIGSVLISSRVSLGNSAIAKEEVSTSQDCTGIILKSSKILSEFLYYYIQMQSNKLKRMGEGSTIKGITQDALEKLSVVYVGLAEQHRIADMLNEIDYQIDIEKRRAKKLYKIKQGLMNDLLTGRKRVKVD